MWANKGAGGYEVLLNGTKKIRPAAIAAIKNAPLKYKPFVFVGAAIAIVAAGIVLAIFDREKKS